MEGTATREIGGAQAPAVGRWTIDPAHSSVSFVARHLMVTKVRGHFGVFSGWIDMAESPEDSTAEVRIDAASIDSGNEGRDEHLRSDDFLGVEEYPELVFRTTGVKLAGDNKLHVVGDLTIRDATQPVELEAELEGIQPDPWGKTRAAFTAKGEIDREAWGITWNQALETGGVLVSKKVQIELEVTAVYEGEQSASS